MKDFTSQQKEIVARKLGYDGPMQGFDAFIASSPALEAKYAAITGKFIERMAKGGLVKMKPKGYAYGGPVYSDEQLFQQTGSWEKAAELRDQQNQAAANIEAEKVALAQELAGRMGSITLEFKAKASTDGRMIGTISHKQIVAALKNIHHIEVDKRKFVDDFIVNAFGLTRLRIELHKGVLGQINVKVMEEKK